MEVKNLKKEYKSKVVNIKINKYNAISESKYGVLIKINKDYYVWVSKNFIRASLFTNFLSVGIIGENDYKGKDRKGEDVVIKGNAIIDFFTNSDEKDIAEMEKVLDEQR